MSLLPDFDYRSDAGGRDPDKYSPQLKQAHKLLWTKPLPDGRLFALSDVASGEYLVFSDGDSVIPLSSDSVIPTFEYWTSPPPFLAEMPASEIEEFVRVSYTMGGMMLFPSERVDGKWTINQARGMMVNKIGDRFDLTLECIRRHYLGSPSPMTEHLARYSSFFELFDDFRGYVDFFLLQDLVESDYLTVRFFTPFDDFESKAVPQSLDDYSHYRDHSVDFVEARNRRIQQWALNAQA